MLPYPPASANTSLFLPGNELIPSRDPLKMPRFSLTTAAYSHCCTRTGPAEPDCTGSYGVRMPEGGQISLRRKLGIGSIHLHRALHSPVPRLLRQAIPTFSEFRRVVSSPCLETVLPGHLQGDRLPSGPHPDLHADAAPGGQSPSPNPLPRAACSLVGAQRTRVQHGQCPRLPPAASVVFEQQNIVCSFSKSALGQPQTQSRVITTVQNRLEQLLPLHI